MTKSSSLPLCVFQRNILNTTPIFSTLLLLLISLIHSRNPMFDLDLASQTLNPQVTGFKMTGKSADSDFFGYSVSTAGDINKDGYADIIVGAYMKDTVYVIYGNDKTTLSNWNFNAGDTLDPHTTGFTVKGNAVGDYFGYSVSTAGDVNKDGYDDIIIGAYKKASSRGEAYVLYGGAKSTMAHLDLSTTPLNPLTTGFTMTGQSSMDYFGYCVSTAGDIDNDGYDDIIIGAYYKWTGLGAVYVIYGAEKSALPNIPLASTTLNPASTGFFMQGGVTGDEFGVAVSTAGDINKDGFADMIVGAASKGSNLNGAVYVIYGGPKNTMASFAPSNPSARSFWITAQSTQDRLGWSVGPAGDINKDGYADIIIGAPFKSSNRGAVYVIYGAEKSTLGNIPLATTPLNPASTGFTLTGYTAGDVFGGSVSTAGDINKDGYADIIIGANKKNGNRGAVYVIYGGEKSSLPNRDFSLGATLDPLISGFMITGDAAGDYLGFPVCTAGDVNKDGYGDIIIGAYGRYSAYVIYASCSANCKQCSSEAVCTECKASFLLYQDQCFATCPAKSYPSAPTCSACPTPCKLCTSSSVCTQCEASYVLYNSQCVNSCPAGRYLSPTTCELCISPCSKCNSATVCTECISSYGLYLSQCVNSCPVGMYLSPTTCETCPTPCSKCTSASVCTECKASYVLYNSQCVNSCPPGRFLSPTTCENCVSPCSECTSLSECTTCVAPYSLFGSQCVTSCPITTYSFNSICNNCSSYCYSCTSKESCQVCFPEFTLQNSLCIFSSSSGDLSYLEAQQKATQIISSATRGIGSVICIGSAAFPLSALVSKIVQNTRYINLSVTSDLAGVYKTWQTNIISWDVPNVMEELDHFETAPILFSQYDLGSPFLVNFWPTLINVGIGFGSFVAFLLLQKLFEQAQYEGWVYSIVQRLVAGSFNFALIQAYACLDDILFYLVLDAKTNPFNSSFSWASIICARLFLAIGCLQVFFNFWTVKKYQNIKTQGGSIEAFNERNKYWELFYSDFNDDDLWSQAFFAIAIIRSAIQSFIITVLYDYPLMQTPFLVIMDGAVLFFLYFKNPFRTLRGKLAQYYYEIITLLVHICAFSMALQDTFKTSSYTVTLIMSTGILYLNTALVSGAIGFMFIEIYETIRLRNKELKRKQRANIPEENQENQNLTAQRTGPFHLSETDVPTKQEETKLSPERFYFFPESYQRNSNNNMTSFDLNTESSSQGLEPNFYGGDSIVTDMNSSNGMNHQISQSPMPIMIRRRTQAFRQRQKTRDPRNPNYRINNE